MSIELLEATPYFSRYYAPALFRNTVASFKLLPDRISSFVTYTSIVIEGLIVLALILGENFAPSFGDSNHYVQRLFICT